MPKELTPAIRTHVLRYPVAQLRVHEERTGLDVECRIGRHEVQAGRNLAVMERKHRLDEAGDARRRIGMADVRLDRADRAIADPIAAGTERTPKPRDLDRVAEVSASAVGLDVADIVGADAGERMRSRDHLGLSVFAWRGVADLGCTVVVERAGLQHRIDRVVVGDCVRKALEHDDTRRLAEGCAVGVRIEGAAAPVRGQNHALLREVADALTQVDADATGECHAALMIEQAARSEMDCDERSGARGLDVHRRAAQAEPMRNPGRQKILVGRDHLIEGRQRIGRVRRAEQGRVVVWVRTGKDADRHRHCERVVAGVLERAMTGLEKDACLRVHHRRFARRKTEEGGVELVHVGERRASPHEVLAAIQIRRYAELVQFFVGKGVQRVDAVAEQIPERLDRRCAGESPRKSDDRDLFGLEVVCVRCHAAHVLPPGRGTALR